MSNGVPFFERSVAKCRGSWGWVDVLDEKKNLKKKLRTKIILKWSAFLAESLSS